MALQPSLSPTLIYGDSTAPHTLEFFWDYICPYSGKSAKCMRDVVIPWLESHAKGKVKIFFRLQVQPWHSTSTLCHEAALAVIRVKPDAFWDYSLALLADQEKFYDIPTSTATPLETRANLVQLGVEKGILDEADAEEVKDLLAHKTTPNGGNAVTNDLKWCVKYSRQNHIHFSPTVLWDGIEEPSVSSSWGEKEWSQFFSNKIVV